MLKTAPTVPGMSLTILESKAGTKHKAAKSSKPTSAPIALVPDQVEPPPTKLVRHMWDPIGWFSGAPNTEVKEQFPTPETTIFGHLLHSCSKAG